MAGFCRATLRLARPSAGTGLDRNACDRNQEETAAFGALGLGRNAIAAHGQGRGGADPATSFARDRLWRRQRQCGESVQDAKIPAPPGSTALRFPSPFPGITISCRLPLDPSMMVMVCEPGGIAGGAGLAADSAGSSGLATGFAALVSTAAGGAIGAVATGSPPDGSRM